MTILSGVVFAVVVVSWIAFAIVFLIGPKSPQPPEKRRDPRSIVGVVLQGISFALVWAVHRTYFTLLFHESKTFELIIGLIAVIAAVGSLLLAAMAVRALGKEWSVTARVIEGHKLATHGPYAWVRHPIYTAMLGMLIATGLAVSYWQVMVIAIVIFVAGTAIRVRSEDKLLRDTFGATFDDYARRVSAIVPGIF
jgi:protein-S-isoprenylcysteine O-methyltransferase Ste14